MTRVLVVDPDPHSLQALVGCVPSGVEKETAATLVDARERLKGTAPCFLVASLLLKGDQARESLAFLHFVHERCPRTRVVVCSPQPSIALEIEVRRLGVSELVSKPAPLSNLNRMVEALVHGRPSLPTGPTGSAPSPVGEVLWVADEVGKGGGPGTGDLIAAAGYQFQRIDPGALAATALLASNIALALIECRAEESASKELGVLRGVLAPTVPVVALVAQDASPELIESCWRAGADDCLMRPLRASEIRARMQALHAPPVSSLAGRLGPRVVVCGCDAPEVLEELTGWLEATGYRVARCPSASQEALTRALADVPHADLVLACAAEGTLPGALYPPGYLADPVPVSHFAVDRRTAPLSYRFEGEHGSVERVLDRVNQRLQRSTDPMQVRDRVPFFVPVQFREADGRGRDMCSGYSYNLSPGGVFLKTLVPIRRGAPVDLRIHLTTSRQVVEGTGVVAWANPHRGRHAHPAGMGVQFLGMSPQGLSQLRELCRLSRAA